MIAERGKKIAGNCKINVLFTFRFEIQKYG
jgi:hypothetical protein